MLSAEIPRLSDRSLTGRNVLFLIVALGVAFRVWHINWDLPEVYEEAYPFTVAWKFWNWGHSGFDFNPHIFNYGALTYYIQFLVQVVHYLIGHLWGVYANLQAYRTAYETNPSSFLILARLVSVAFDIGIMVVTYSLAIRVRDGSTAMLTVAMIALNHLHIRESHLVSVDTPLTFFVMLSIYFLIQSYETSSRTSYLLTGLAIGLSAATKYTGAFLLPVFVAAHLLKARSLRSALGSLRSSDLLYGLLLSGLVFIVLNPFIILSFDEFYGSFSFIYYNVIEYGHLGVVAVQSTLGFYLLDVIPNNLGPPLTLAICLSIVYLLGERKKEHLLLLIFPLFYLAVISRWEYRADRYILPAFPMLMLIGSIGLLSIRDRLRERLRPASLTRGKELTGVLYGLDIVLAALLLGPMVMGTFNYQNSHSTPDIRTIAKDWISKNIPPGSAIATIPIGMTFPSNHFHLLLIPYHPVLTNTTAPFYDTRFYHDLDLFIVSGFDYGRYTMEPLKYKPFVQFYDSIRGRWSLIHEFKPRDHQNGPEIWLYQPAHDSANAVFDTTSISKLRDAYNGQGALNFAGKLGSILFLKGRLNKAEQLLRLATEFDPMNLLVHTELSKIYFQLKKYGQASQELEMAIALNPGNKDLVGMKGHVDFELGRLDEAEKSFNKVLMLDDHDGDAYETLILIDALRENKPHMIETLSRYKKVLPAEQAKIVEEKIQKLKDSP